MLCMALMPLLLAGCRQANVFEENRTFEETGWYRFDILTFDADIDDADERYDLLLHFRHTQAFMVPALKINFTVTSAEGEMRSADHELVFRDREGKSLSTCSRDKCEIIIPLRQGYSFSRPGTYRFEIENKHTKTELPGILEAGLVIRKSKK